MNRILYLLLGAAIGLSGCAAGHEPGVVLAKVTADGPAADALANGPALEAAAAASRRIPIDRAELAPALQVIDRVAANRPDLQAARRRLGRAERRLAIAEAGSAPPSRHAAIPAFRSSGMTNLVRTGSDIGQAALGSWPISLDTAEDRRATALSERDAALGAYDRVLVRAIREVADAMVQRRSLAIQLEAARVGLTEAMAACASSQRSRPGAGSKPAWRACIRDAATRRHLLVALQARYDAADRGLLHVLGTATPRKPGLVTPS